MKPGIAASRKREQGAALLVTALILALVGTLAFAGIRHSEQESTAGARSRSTTRAFHAADSGIQMALARLGQDPPDLTSFDVNLAPDANLQSRTRTETLPQDLDQVGLGETPEGETLNAGAGVGTVVRVYLVNVTATTNNGSTTELEAKLSRTGAEATGY